MEGTTNFLLKIPQLNASPLTDMLASVNQPYTDVMALNDVGLKLLIQL